MKLKAILILATLVTLAASTVAAHDGTSHGEQSKLSEATAKIAPPDSTEQKARNYFTDLPVVTQDGTELRFFSDVLKDRVVLVSLFFANCEQACPLTTGKLARVQNLLREELGRSIFFISITLDPERDTPEVLKSYAQKFVAGDGWLFLTVEKENLRQITRRLGHVTSQIEAHNTHYMIGNVKIARWSKLPPNLSEEAIAARLRQMAEHTAND